MLCGSNGPGLRAKGWLYELKLDGVRIVAEKRGRTARLWYRSGRATSASYPEIAVEIAHLAVEDAVFDGEIVAFDDAGKPSFQRLGQRIGLENPRDVAQAAVDVPVVYVVFDLLALGDEDLRARPLVERRQLLERVVPDAGLVRCLDYLEDDGTPLFDLCRRERLEGVIVKRAGSPYRSGMRSDDWIKMKCEEDDDFVVVAITRGTGSRGDLGALDVASYDADGNLVVRGKVGSGLDERTVRTLLARSKELETKAPVARGEYMPAPRGRTHLRPEIVVNVRYGGWTDDGRLRFSVFRGIRDDVLPSACTAAPPRASGSGDLEHYYEAAGDALMRYLTRRCPAVQSKDALRSVPPPFRVRTDGWVVFDADLAGARSVRGLMDAIGLPAYAKTGDALDWHIVVPVGDAPPEGARAFAELIAHTASPGVVRVASSPILAPWSPLAGAGSRVSLPVPWEEVAPGLEPRRWTTHAAAGRARGPDPMAPLLEARVDFAAAATKLAARLTRG